MRSIFSRATRHRPRARDRLCVSEIKDHFGKVEIMAGNPEDRRKTPEGSKRCPACGEVKPVSEFYSNPSQRDGLDSACRACHIARRRDYRRRNLAYERERQRLYARARYWRARYEALLRSAGSVRDDDGEAG